MTNPQQYEPYLRMAISNIRNSIYLAERLPGSSQQKTAAIHDMAKAIEHLERFAVRMRIEVRDGMKT